MSITTGTAARLCSSGILIPDEKWAIKADNDSNVDYATIYNSSDHIMTIN